MSQLDVCVIEDDPDQLRLVTRMLQDAGFAVEPAEDLASGLELARRRKPKTVLCDYELPDGDGDELCRQLRGDPQHVDTHIILMTGSPAVDLEADALDTGADDFVLKPIDRRTLIARVRVGVRMHTLRQQLHDAAITDGLTKLCNHDHLNRVLELEMGRSRRYGHPLALIMLDIDHFKAINDTYGHLVGNQVLQAVARILAERVRDVDTVGRFGGDEFAIVLPEATVADAVQVAERVCSEMPGDLAVPATRGQTVTASFGVADVDDARVTNTADLVDLADRALYVAKGRGRCQVATACDVDEGTSVASVIQTDEVESLRQRVAVLSMRARDVYVQGVASLTQALEERDPYTARHSRNVAFYAELIAEQIGCSLRTRQAIRDAAILHDIGKVGVPDAILMKRSKLTTFEHMVMDQVPIIGTRIVDHLHILEPEIEIIRHQRERFDGTGIPAGLKGDQIPIGSRVVLVADAFDAMTSDRVYRDRRPIDGAMAELRRHAGSQFDPRVVLALRQILERQRTTFQARIEETLVEGRASHARDPRQFASDPL